MYADVEAVATGWRRRSGSNWSGFTACFKAAARSGPKTAFGLADQLPEAVQCEAKSVACGPIPLDAVGFLDFEQALPNH